MASNLTRLRFQLPGAILVAVLLPAIVRSHMHLTFSQPTLVDAGAAAAVAIAIGCYFIRRVRNFPGVRSGVHIPFAVTAAFGIALVILLLFRLQYSRTFVAASYLLTLAWFVGLHLLCKRFARPLVAIVPGGHASGLRKLAGVRWRELSSPEDMNGSYSAITADLRQDIPDEWERVLTEATLSGTPVYHSKTLSESLTGRVEIEHLYENGFGSVLPSLTYLKAKFLADWLLAVFLLPAFLIVAAVVGVLILVDSGGPVFYRQERVGYRGRIFNVYKFRTMTAASGPDGDGRTAAMTQDGDKRITRARAFPQALPRRRTAAAAQHAEGRDELDRPASRGKAAVAMVRARAALLPLPPRRAAGNLRLGAGQPGPRRAAVRRPDEAALRLLLHQVYLALARHADRAADGAHRAVRLRREVGEGVRGQPDAFVGKSRRSAAPQGRARGRGCLAGSDRR